VAPESVNHQKGPDTTAPPSICLAMIVRNEARTLPRLVASLDGVIDRWLIIDTGSDDRTPEVARALLGHLPGELVQRPWVNFGHNRTELMDRCRDLEGVTHLLLVDADHEVEVGDGLRAQLASSTADRFWVWVHSGPRQFQMPYLVRKGPHWVYRGPTHEYLDCDEPITSELTTELSITHHADGGHRAEKYTRDLDMLLQHLDEHPDDSRSTFYLGQTYLMLGRPEEAIATYERRVTQGGFYEERYYALLMIGDLQTSLGRPAEALWAWQRAIQQSPGRAEAYHRLGRALNQHQQWWPARVWLEHGAQLAPTHDKLFVEGWVAEWGIDFELALARWWTGDRSVAMATFAELAERSDVDPAHREACRSNMRFDEDQTGLVQD